MDGPTNTIFAEHINSVYAEVEAIEAALLNGFTHTLKPSVDFVSDLGTATLRWRDAYIGQNLYLANGSFLQFGSDVRLQRPQADLLLTPDSIEISGGLGVGVTNLTSGLIWVRKSVDAAWPVAIFENLSTGPAAQLQLMLDRVTSTGLRRRWMLVNDLGNTPKFNIESVDESGTIIATPIALGWLGDYVTIGAHLIPIDHYTRDLGTSALRWRDLYLLTLFLGQFIEGTEISVPSAPNVDGWRLFGRDNGSGKTQLCVLFNTGAVQVLATQP